LVHGWGGAGVGDGVGEGVGDGVGLGVGLGIGLGVGLGVGAAVGDAEGSGIDVGVGVGVGLGIGVGVGVGVGCTKFTSSTPTLLTIVALAPAVVPLVVAGCSVVPAAASRVTESALELSVRTCPVRRPLTRTRVPMRILAAAAPSTINRSPSASRTVYCTD
jgi:hypothetical protein